MLTVEGLRSRYGRIEVLHGLDLEVSSGEIVTVVGANGAGKTTLLKCLSGTQPVSDGSIVFRGESFASVPAHKRLKRGLAQSPEGRQIFVSLTVEENLLMGAHTRHDGAVARDADHAVQLPVPSGVGQAAAALDVLAFEGEPAFRAERFEVGGMLGGEGVFDGSIIGARNPAFSEQLRDGHRGV